MDIKAEIMDTSRYIIIGLVLAVILNFGMGLVLGADKPVMAVISGSMEPTFFKGDIVVIKGVPAEELVVGDIIVYTNPLKNIPVVHRIYDIQEVSGKKFFFTKGDNKATNAIMDQGLKFNPDVTPEEVMDLYLKGKIDARAFNIAPPLTEENIRGKEIIVIPNLGWVKVAFSDMVADHGIVKVMVGVLVIFFSFGFIEDFFKKRKETR